MGFQGSMVVTREASKDYVVLSTNQSKKLLSGGQMSCNKDAATFWTSSDNLVKEPMIEEHTHTSEIVLGKDMNEWIKEFVQNEFFRGSNNVDVGLTKPEVTEEPKSEKVEMDDESNDVDMDEDSIIDVPDIEDSEKEEENDISKLSINDETKSCKGKRNFKVFKFMKKAIKRHIKK